MINVTFSVDSWILCILMYTPNLARIVRIVSGHCSDKSVVKSTIRYDDNKVIKKNTTAFRYSQFKFKTLKLFLQTN